MSFHFYLSVGLALAIISHVLCSRFPMFGAKLLTHMMVGCLGTQVRKFTLSSEALVTFLSTKNGHKDP